MRTLRAAIAVGLLAGFYVLAIGIVAGFAGLGVYAALGGRVTVGLKLFFAAGVVALAVGRALYVVAKAAASEDADGHPVTPEEQPVLWAEVRALADAAQTRPPDEIRLIADVNAAVSEKASLLGLRGGTRTLYLGVPLLMGLTVDQLRSVLAHELGHYSGAHTRLGVVTYRGMEQLAQVVEHLGDHKVLGLVFRAYRRVYLAVALAVSRRQELEADGVSARLVGPTTAAAALRELAVIEAAWMFYQRNYVSWAVSGGVRPVEFFGGLRSFLTDPGRAGTLAEIRAAGGEEKASWSDSHPPISRRVMALSTYPALDRTPDDRPAVALLTDADETLRVMVEEILIDEVRALPALPWEQAAPVAGSAMTLPGALALQSAADELSGSPATVADVLHLFDSGRAGSLGERVTGRTYPETTPEAAQAAAEALATYVVALGLGVGAVRWQLSWSGPLRLVDRSGAPVEVDAAANRAIDPDALRAEQGTAEVRALLHRFGVPAEARITVPEQPAAAATPA